MLESCVVALTRAIESIHFEVTITKWCYVILKRSSCPIVTRNIAWQRQTLFLFSYHDGSQIHTFIICIETIYLQKQFVVSSISIRYPILNAKLSLIFTLKIKKLIHRINQWSISMYIPILQTSNFQIFSIKRYFDALFPIKYTQENVIPALEGQIHPCFFLQETLHFEKSGINSGTNKIKNID